MNNSGYFEGHQNSLISRLCAIIIKTETYRIRVKAPTCIMFTIIHKRQEVLAIEYSQNITVINNKLSCIFYFITFQNPLFFFHYCGFLHVSLLSLF